MLLKVENMSCQHCVRSVTAALRALDAEARVDVDLARGEVRAQGGFTPQAAVEALAEADYPAQLVAADG